MERTGKIKNTKAKNIACINNGQKSLWRFTKTNNETNWQLVSLHFSLSSTRLTITDLIFCTVASRAVILSSICGVVVAICATNLRKTRSEIRDT